MGVPNRKPDGYFDCFETWVNKATSWIGGTNPVCYDAADRQCNIGKDFARARDENTFPVRFWYGEGNQTPAQQRQSKRNAKAALKAMYPWRYY